MSLAVSLSLALPTAAFAADCSTQKTQLDINQCEAAAFQKADKDLNTVYSSYRARLNQQQKQQLKDAQLAWIKFRDLSCQFESSGVSGGSAYAMVQQSCLADKTRTRIEDLKKLTNCKEGDLSCPAFQ